jgi:hypothetical protein
VIKFAGVDRRNNVGLFADEDDSISHIIQLVKGNIKDIENVYTQHEPLLKKTITNIFSGKIQSEIYPFHNLTSKMM